MSVDVPEPQQVKEVDDNLVVTIPAEVAAQHGIAAGDLVRVHLTPVAAAPRLADDLVEHVEAVLERDAEALRFLRDS